MVLKVYSSTGMMCLAMYHRSVKEALQRARSGKGPTLIEAYTYRLSNHTTSDDASKYRCEKETRNWENRSIK